MVASMLRDFSSGISNHLMSLENKVDVTGFLSEHKVSPDYRAKMIDWMVEVLSTFRCSDQAFFKTIQIMDRYYALSPAKLGSSSLHLTGIVCMLIATKYEDVVPLLMRTIVNKIGHKKFSKAAVLEREMQILQTINFELGSPTVLEHLELMSAEIAILSNSSTQLVFKYLAKLSMHNYELSQLSSSELAGAIAYVGLKICEKTPNTPKADVALNKLKEMCSIDIKSAKLNGRYLLNLAKSFEKDHPTLKNLRDFYSEELKRL